MLIFLDSVSYFSDRPGPVLLSQCIWKDSAALMKFYQKPWFPSRELVCVAPEAGLVFRAAGPWRTVTIPLQPPN